MMANIPIFAEEVDGALVDEVGAALVPLDVVKGDIELADVAVAVDVVDVVSFLLSPLHGDCKIVHISGVLS